MTQQTVFCSVPLSFLSLLVLPAAAATSLTLIAALRRALPAGCLSAAVDQRSNHAHPARQIGGLGAVPAAAAVLAAVLWLAGVAPGPWLALGAGAFVLWLAGLADDWRPAGAVAKFTAQFAAAAIVVVWGGLRLPLFEVLPPVVSGIILAVVLVWFVNMVNFMDGLDLLTASGAGLSVLFAGTLCLLLAGDTGAWLAGLAVFAALAGFAVHNRPPAPVFLGDSGSLPLGLAAGFLALKAAETASPVLALLPFAYYLADTLTTVAKRALERKNVLKAHSEHAYQVARRAGVAGPAIVARIAAVGVVSGAAALVGAVAAPTVSIVVIAAGWLTGLALVLHFRRAGGLAPG